ncbi:MAG: hypothetical protein E7377_00760 [Clostridiales bacterium]|nr:hypothetical protein [Clostridiales bacterium]
MKKFKKQMIRILSLCSATCFVLGACAESAKTAQNNVLNEGAGTYTEKTNGSIKTNQENFYDENVIYQLPDSVALNTDISVIVTMSTKSLVKTYLSTEKEDTVSDFIKSKEGKETSKEIETERKNLIKKLKKSGVDYTLGEQYDTVLSGFEITIKAKDFDTVSELFKNDAQLIVGEVYEPAITEVVTNEVDVYDTGIFTGLDDYKGDGVVVAVLDTGLDYTHSAFLPENFPEMGIKEDVAFELDDIKGILADKKMVAETTTSGLTANDVYLNKKVPYMYDYADKDPDVMPINSEHGTHVAGIIAGQDNTITGVAPNAQLAIMKVFSDTQTGAKTSWILAALEDCVNLGVDVINMSLGSGCGFARESDDDVSTTYDKTINQVYDSVRDAGISLIAAAGNDYTSTMNSEKNGSLSLTSNPDFGTVGSPSTYAAALSVASVDGVQTPYIKYGDEIIYFNEASTSDGKPRNFVDGLLNNYEAQTGIKTDTQEFEYITIPGIGRESDYMSDIDYTGKIVLVKRGTTTFEEKVRIALKVMGATGIIIYNNVSGMISMAVGDNVGPVCSIAQDEGEMLAANPTGTIVISRNNTAGPFMSEFSGWGPTSDLQIKPEITAHGGEILSAMPGNGYERMSGTSMAAPNQAGATALIRQYVRYSGQFGDNYEELTTSEACEVTAIVNQLMMSTADILSNKNGLPYAVRKQGAGLINLRKATTTEAYLTTFDKTGALMDKAKIELGDDKTKSGAYTMELAINNISASTVSYNVDSIMLTEGVAKTYTGHDEQTVTQEGYILNSTTTVKEVGGVAATSNTVTVGAKQTVKIKVEIVLSAEDKAYLDESFANGMYVEGFIKLEAQGDTKVNLSVPVLAFYGDWTKAPIFDEEYYDTHKDELNEGLNHEDKVMADAYATRVLGGLYSDYITTLGTYYFKQDPKATPIAANKEHIAISNQYDDTDEEDKGNLSTVNSIHSIYAGLLRNCREVNISIVEDSTGEEVFYRSEKKMRKSAYRGGGIGPSAIDVEFSSIEHNLKNNTKYTVTVTAYIDYGDNADQKNERNTFTFPLYIDFQAPAVTDVRYRSEYDRTTKKTKLFADIDVYDNHYAMAMQLGQIIEADENSEYTYEMDTFGKYFTPIYSSYNSTSTVTVELTDYVDRLKKSVGSAYDEEGKNQVVYNNNSFIAICYDYAMNAATYEIRLPDEILTAAFTEEEIQLTVGRTKDLTSIMSIYPSESWVQTLDFVSENPAIASVVNNVVVGKGEGETVINAVKKDANNNERIVASIPITVAPGSGFGSMEVVNKFELTGYYTNKAYYSVSSDEREIGETDSTNAFGKDGAILSMYPSESVTIEYTLDSYYPDETKVVMESMNEDIAIIREMKDEDGNPLIDPKTGEVKLEIVAQAEGRTDISIDVYQFVDGEWEMTMTSESVSIEVKDPFTVSGMYLMSYKGLGGVVEIPSDRGITAIYQYAFSNYEYIPKDENDEINEEDPFYIKPWYIGEDTITKVIIPEGVTAIESYAFANLTALEEVVLPKSLVRIGVGAFTGCVKLKKINLDYAKFINEEAFKDCPLTSVKLDSAVSIGNYTFQNTKISALTLPVSSQSLGIGAFADNAELRTLNFAAPKMKIGSYAFSNCPNLNNVVINASVIASYAFYDCVKLENVTIGKDVAVIGEFAFTGTNVSQFKVEDGGVISVDEENSANLLKNNELILVAPKGATMDYVIGNNVTSIAAGAFAGNTKIQNVTALDVEVVGEYAFAECLNLKSVNMPKVKTVGNYAFAGTSLTAMPDSEVLTEIGDYAFAGTLLTEVTIMPDANVGAYAFGGFVVMESGQRVNRYTTETLVKVTVGNGATIGEGAFNAPIYMATYENIESLYYYKPYTYYLQDKDGNYISEDGEIVANKADAKQYTYYTYDFSKAGAGIAPSILKEVYIGEEVTIGRNSFSGNAKLQTLEFGNGTTVGDYAFMNSAFYDENVLQEVDLSGVVSIGEYAFSGTSLYDYQVIETESKTEEAPKEFIVNAYKYVYVHGEDGEEGEERITHYQTTKFAPIFKKADVSGATYIGEGAFAYNEKLEEVIFSEQLEEIPAYAFALCSSLAKADLTASIKTVNEYAFYLTAFSGESVDLKNVETIGEAAFASSKITKVTFKDGATIGESAFKDCELLTGVDVSKVKEIGAEAFYGTSLTFADLTSATKVGDFAFGESKVTGVKLGSNLEDLGENPFYACAIETYGTTEDVYFNNEKLESKLVETYNVNDKVLVINGVLYQKVKAGLELISYPMNKVGKAYAVEEGTTRITARALAGSMLEDVTFPTTLMAVGDKALYDCKNLSVVVFKSYFAPVLEEDYDQSRISYDNLAMTGQIGEYVGLGIVKYYMWNSTSHYTNFYFGANFVDFIGDIDKHVVMVKPANGRNYSTFIFSQYFNTVVEGSNAAMEETISVISLINSLPEEISLSDEAAILAARAAYDKIMTLEQKSLVGNYNKLTSAESTLEYLKSRVETPDDPETPPAETPDDPETPPTEEPKDGNTGYVIAIVALSVALVGVAGYFVCDKFIFSKKTKKNNEKSEE